MSTTRGMEFLSERGSSKNLASFGEWKVNIFQRPKATMTLTLPNPVSRGGSWGGSSVRLLSKAEQGKVTD